METIILPNDINTFYVTATSFPDGIMDAHKAIHTLLNEPCNRRNFGISRPEHGVIVYRAAVEENFDRESDQYNCDALTLKKGHYVAITIHDYATDLPAIGNAFQQLLHQPGIDLQGYCVEAYFNDTDVRCMVRLQD